MPWLVSPVNHHYRKTRSIVTKNNCFIYFMFVPIFHSERSGFVLKTNENCNAYKTFTIN